MAGRNESIAPEDVDGAFVPRPRPALAVDVDDETLLVDRDTGATVVLNPTGALVWRCLAEEEGPVDDLAADLAEAFGADLEVVGRDVLTLVQELGRAGLLEGVAARAVTAPGFEEHAIGSRLPAFTLPDLDGALRSVTDHAGGRVLLVHWNPDCVFCAALAPGLAALAPALDQAGVRIVLLAAGTAEANREMWAAHGVAFPTLLTAEARDDFDNPFASHGTPVAYLLDEGGTVAAPLAVGAVDVAGLAREAAGVADAGAAPAPSEEQLPATPRFLEEPAST